MIGSTVSHYRILEHLGGGGMGVLYKAEDLNLGRTVALKFLPDELTHDPMALERFRREARAASSLNHSNICTIYEIGEHDGRPFIAMELLEGSSVELAMMGRKLPLEQVLDIGIQATNALEAAHTAGIVHRDIKPGNIFLTSRGEVKILDFGLAKLSHERKLARVGPASSRSSHLTGPGTAMGTIAYMSPEQARGEDLDGRSDIFSMGTVLYEIASGKHPFPGNTSAVVFDGILNREPVEHLTDDPVIPEEFERIVNRCLAKKKEERYQTAADLRSDLRQLKRDVDLARESRPMLVSPKRSFAKVRTARQEASAIRMFQQRLGLGHGAVILAVVLMVAGFGLYTLLRPRNAQPFRDFTITKITSSGNTFHVAISPDGKYMATTRREADGRHSLLIRNLQTNSDTPIMPPAGTYFGGVTFSPDGKNLYYRQAERENIELFILYRVPVTGGEPARLVRDIDSDPTFSPDGQRMMFVRMNAPEMGKYQLIEMNKDGGDEKMLEVGDRPYLNAPQWSPDGKSIAAYTVLAGDTLGTLFAMDAKSLKRHTLWSARDSWFGSQRWLPDGQGLIVTSITPRVNLAGGQLVYVPYPDGDTRRITNDTNAYADLSVTADGKSVAAVMRQLELKLQMVPEDGEAPPRDLANHVLYGFDWMPDGSAIAADESGIVLVRPDSPERRQLIAGEKFSVFDASSCDDGKYVVFSAQKAGESSINVWRMDAGGGGFRRLTDAKSDIYPKCSPDGSWVYYQDAVNEHLRRVPVEGGKSEPVPNVVWTPGDFDISPDGEYLATTSMAGSGDGSMRLSVIELRSGGVKYLPIDTRAVGGARFSPSGDAVAYIIRSSGVDNIYLQPLDGSQGKQITNFTSEQIRDFHWSQDGETLGVVRGHLVADAVLIRQK